MVAVGNRTLRDLRRRRDRAGLLAALPSDEWRAKRDASLALGDLSVVDAVPEIRAALSHRHPRVRLAAAQALGSLPDQQAADALASHLVERTEPRLTVRFATARSYGRLRELGIVGSPDPVPVLASEARRAVGDTTHDFGPTSAIRCLGLLRAPEATDPLLELLQAISASPPDDPVRRRLTTVFLALGHSGDQRAADALAMLLPGAAQHDRYTAATAAAALARLGDDRGLRHLLHTARLGYSQGANAIRNLVALEDPRLVEDFLRLLEEPPDDVTELYAAIGLTRLGREEGRAAIRTILDRPVRDLRDMSGLITQAAITLGDPLEARQVAAEDVHGRSA